MSGVRRREFIALLGGAAAAWPIASRAQEAERVRHIGVLLGSTQDNPDSNARLAALRQGLERLGWSESRNVNIDYRFAAGIAERAQVLARELVAQNPDLIVSNTNLVTSVLQSETRTIPIVFVGVSDPVGSGFVTNLARPSGNLTGFANFEPSMGSKWLEKLREIAPQVKRVGLMLHPEPPNVGFLRSAEATAPSLQIELVGLAVHSGTDIDRGVEAFAVEPYGGLIIAPNAVTFGNSDRIVALAARYRLPAIYPFAFFAKSGGLISYGSDASDQFREAAAYADKILKGTKPTDLPVQLPTKFESVVNLKTAKALGLEIPATLLALADEVIE